MKPYMPPASDLDALSRWIEFVNTVVSDKKAIQKAIEDLQEATRKHDQAQAMAADAAARSEASRFKLLAAQDAEEERQAKVQMDLDRLDTARQQVAAARADLDRARVTAAEEKSAVEAAMAQAQATLDEAKKLKADAEREAGEAREMKKSLADQQTKLRAALS